MNLMSKLFAPRAASGRASVGLLLLRVVAGIAFMLHGWPKIQNPFAWMGEGASIPGVFQALAAVAEFAGGAAWALGALMPLASLGLLCTMVVAVHMHAIVRGDPFVGKGGSYELAALYLVISIMFLLIGPGRLALDALLFKRPPEPRT